MKNSPNFFQKDLFSGAAADRPMDFPGNWLEEELAKEVEELLREEELAEEDEDELLLEELMPDAPSFWDDGEKMAENEEGAGVDAEGSEGNELAVLDDNDEELEEDEKPDKGFGLLTGTEGNAGLIAERSNLSTSGSSVYDAVKFPFAL